MSKQISAVELAEIVTNLLANPPMNAEDAPRDAFADFMTEVASAVCDFAGGRLISRADDWVEPGEHFVGIVADERLPEDGGVFKDYDHEGDLTP